MRKFFFLVLFFLISSALADNDLIERWANAAGGRDKVAAIKSIYREATLEFGGYQGSLKVWHTADGKYRKEEKMGDLSSVEIFDGTKGTIQEGDGPPREMTARELELSKAKRFANANAMFFAFFPERRHGSVAIEADNTIVLKSDGGVEWRVSLDAQTALPKTMVHKEGDRTITVTFDSYETVEGIKFEKEIHRSAGGPNGAVIRFTKTLINPPIESSLFGAKP
ncbi:MAG: hypothetical protein DME97_10085 [Verrucomicrobia bacterium]|nr:MAG: hypothetical protein DME97_10085 [Verrucomicrobiota bacterium]